MTADEGSPSVFDRLGVKRVINGQGWVTLLGGSIMPPEVLQAMVDVAQCYVNLDELNQKAGEVIARHTAAEAGLVTSGAASGMLLEAAACMTGTDLAKVAQLPDTTGMRNEIVIHRSQRVVFDRNFRAAGAKLVEVGNARGAEAWEIEAAINDKTAAVAMIFAPWLRSTLSLPEVVDIAHKHGVPVIVDAAAKLPPAENLRKYISQGADMVIFSGGKGIEGPQSTGILCGRKDLIEAARLNMSPNHMGVGRPCKVCKEELAALIVALERFVSLDHEARWAKWRAVSQAIVEALQGISGLTVQIEEDFNHHGPQAVVYFQPTWKGASGKEVQAALRRGNPPIYIGLGGYQDELSVNPVNLQEGEEHIIARRLREELTAAQN